MKVPFGRARKHRFKLLVAKSSQTLCHPVLSTVVQVTFKTLFGNQEQVESVFSSNDRQATHQVMGFPETATLRTATPTANATASIQAAPVWRIPDTIALYRRGMPRSPDALSEVKRGTTARTARGVRWKMRAFDRG